MTASSTSLLASPHYEGGARPGQPPTVGFSDELGERHLVFDSTSATSLEVLHFRPAFSASPAFESALRTRVAEVGMLQHPSLATVRAVERRDGETLCLVSKHTAGRRVSDLVAKARGPAFALELIRELTPALAALQRLHAAHGLISAERIVVTREGRLVLVEHVLGSAIEAMQLSGEQLADLGVIVPSGSDAVRFDDRTDLIQLGCTGLALLLGRPIQAAEYPLNIPRLLDEFIISADSPAVAAKLRVWLERALQISPRSFASAAEAQAGLADLPDPVGAPATSITRPAPAASFAAAPRPAPAVPASSSPAPFAPAAERPAAPVAPPAPKSVETHREAPAASAPTPAPAPALKTPAAEKPAARPVSALPSHAHEPIEVDAPRASRMGLVAAALGVIAAVEAVAIGVLLYARPVTEPIEVRPPAAGTAAAMPAPVAAPLVALADHDSEVAPAAPAAAEAADTTAPAVPAAPAPVAPAPAGSRFGGVKIASTIDLQVFKDGALVGSTAGPIALGEGTQHLEFVNEDLGFRLQQTLNVKPGQMTSVTITPPNGRISINAVPWAEVSIDGTVVGQTPLANLSLPIGTHEIVFRHPQLGERKQTVVIKMDGLTKVTQTFGQEAGNEREGAR